VSGLGLRQWLKFCRHSGAGFFLLPVLTELLFVLWIPGKRQGASLWLNPHDWAAGLPAIQLLTIFTWMMAGQYHARTAFEARLLCVPKAPRFTLISLIGTAIAILILLLVPVYVARGPVFLWLAAIAFALGAGLLLALFGGSRWQAPLYMLCLILVFYAGNPLIVGPWGRDFWGPAAFAVWPILLWRLHALEHAFQAGLADDFLRYISSKKPNMFASWAGILRTSAIPKRQTDSTCKAPTNVYRAAFGPIFQPNEIFFGVLLSLWPVMMSVPSRELLTVFERYFAGVMIFPLMGIASGAVTRRVERISNLLWIQSGELADIALLPGLGNVQAQRRALLQEALFRPLIYYGLWSAGIVSVWIGFPALMHASVPLTRLLLVLPLWVMMLYALLSVGVLSGVITRSSSMLKGLVTFFSAVFPALLVLASLRPSMATWTYFILWAALTIMTVYLWRWVVTLNQQPYLLSR
jgi:hypothetical protein